MKHITNSKAFAKIFERRVELCRRTLIAKANHYANEQDRFHNFRRAAGIEGNEPEQALIGMWIKHIVSVVDMVEKLPVICDPQHQWDEKIGDAINYLILLDGLIQERMLNNEYNK